MSDLLFVNGIPLTKWLNSGDTSIVESGSEVEDITYPRAIGISYHFPNLLMFTKR